MRFSQIVGLSVSVALAACAAAAPLITVTVDKTVTLPAKGRVVVFLIGKDSGIDSKTPPIDGPFWDSEQPLFGVDVQSLTPETTISIGDQADAYPVKLSALKPGQYRAQACLISKHLDSNWKRVDGNLFSDAQNLVIDSNGNGSVNLVFNHQTHAAARAAEGIEWFAAPSALLSEFRGEPTKLRAGVVFPIDYDPARRYAAIYRVPGFGGDDLDAPQFARERAESTGAARELAKESFLIVLNPEGPNGHTLFADSANNGPCSRALTEELIPALEKKFPLIAKPQGRLLLGHSSGGWSTLWLALSRPDVFGATWAISPDPVDFRKFQTVNIYDEKNFYVPDAADAADRKAAPDRPSFRDFDRTTGTMREVMTIRREARQEDVLGPNNTSAQQWDSWFAVFGPRDGSGHPEALFDPSTGVIDHAVAEKYRGYDIGNLLRANPKRYLPLFDTNVHLIVGSADSFYLNEAVALLQADVIRLQSAGSATTNSGGYIKIVPKYDHGSILGSPEVKSFSAEMLKFLRPETPAH